MPFRTPLRTFAVVGLAGVVAAGCSTLLGFEDTLLRGEDAEAGVDAGAVDASQGATDAQGVDTGVPSGPRFSLSPASIRANRGASTNVTVTVDRAGTALGAVEVQFTGLPGGITAAPKTIAADATQVVLSIAVPLTAEVGAKPFRVTSTGDVVAALDATLLVSDRPGALDISFDNDGIYVDTAAGPTSVYNAVAAESDGAALAGGIGATGWLLRRFDKNGVPDAAFNAKITGLGWPAEGQLEDIVVDAARKKIICTGTSADQLTVVRLNMDGSRDNGFGNNGLARLDNVSFSQGSTGMASAVRADGTIISVGSETPGPTTTGLVVHFDAAGNRDTSFRASTANGALIGVSLDPNGNITAGAQAREVSPPRYGVLRLTASGADAGYFTLTTEGSPRGFAVSPAGRFLFAGANLDTTGLLTTGAAPNGTTTFVTNVFAGSTGRNTAIAALLDERFVAVGYGGGTYDKFARVERRFGDGGLDRSLNDGGVVEFEDPATPDLVIYRFEAVALQADGRILVAGVKNNAGPTLMRLWD